MFVDKIELLMKKIIIIFCAFAGISVQAQYDTLPHNIGLPNYFMNHSLDSLSVIQHDDAGCFPRLYNIGQPWNEYGILSIPWTNHAYADSGDFAFGFYPDSTIHVIGVAWTVWLGSIFYGDSSTWFWDSIVVKLFHPSGDRMSMLYRKTIIRDTFTYSKVMDYRKGWTERDSVSLTQSGLIRETPSPIYEVFFDNEYDLQDSLYLSVKYWKEGYYKNNDVTLGYTEWHNRGGIIPFVYPIQTYRMKDTPGDDDSWTYGEQHSYPLLFPIIRLEGDTCPEVHNVSFIKVGNSAAIAQWDEGTNHRDWQFYIGPQGSQPDEAEAVTERLPRHVLNGLSPTAHYDVYVRARCMFARDTWSPWTGPIDFCLSTLSVDGAKVVDWSLTPNPAHGSATVRCGEGIRSVEVLTVKGECLQRQDALGEETCTLDLGGLAKGIYIVQVTTAQGTAARKLAVE